MTGKLILINASNWTNDGANIELTNLEGEYPKYDTIPAGRYLVISSGESVKLTAEFFEDTVEEAGYSPIEVTINGKEI